MPITIRYTYMTFFRRSISYLDAVNPTIHSSYANSFYASSLVGFIISMYGCVGFASEFQPNLQRLAKSLGTSLHNP